MCREHAWPGNFRELGSAVARMATLADGYRITVIDVEVELETLGRGSRLDPIGRVNRGRTLNLVHRVLTDATVDAADLFDLNALEGMLEIVRDAHSMADAGRRLFAASRLQKTNCNDSDRVRKYLAGWGLDYRGCKDALRESA